MTDKFDLRTHDDNPPLEAAFMAGMKPSRRGRPKLETPKVNVKSGSMPRLSSICAAVVRAGKRGLMPCWGSSLPTGGFDERHRRDAEHGWGVDMNLRSEMKKDAKLLMRDGLLRVNPDVVIDDRGYVAIGDWRENLLTGIDAALIEPDFRSGRGSELDSKFQAAHSSAALVVNAFGPFRDGQTPLVLPEVGELNLERFEQTYPTGVGSRIPPHLDASARGAEGIVAIESKCLEYFTAKRAEFAEVYRSLKQFSKTPWFAEMERLRGLPADYQTLDVAQLIKHAFGLMHSAGDGATLVYVFWEPEDAHHHAFFEQHRAEIALLKRRTEDGPLSFVAFSYPELWEAWARSEMISMQQHAARLRLRYGGKLGSYEGYTRFNGRKVDADFFG